VLKAHQLERKGFREGGERGILPDNMGRDFEQRYLALAK